MTFAEAVLRMPPNFYLQCAVEENREDNTRFLSAVIMEKPPVEGWSSLDAYFGSLGNRDDGRLELYKFDDSCRVGVSASINDPASFERLTIGMIDRRWPSLDNVR